MTAPHGSPRYEIKDHFLRRLWNQKSAVLWVVVIIVGIYGISLIFGGSHGPGSIPPQVGIPVLVVGYLFIATVAALNDNDPYLAVEQPGVRLDEAKIPWPSIRQLVVLTPDGADASHGAVEIGVRLRFGAPLPDGMGYVIYDPRDPDVLHFWNSIPVGRFEPARFDAAVRAFAPPGVQVVGEDPGRVHRPERPATSGPRQDAPATVLAVRMHDHGGGQAGNIHSYKPYPVVGFTLPDGRHVIAETDKPGKGQPGEQVTVSYDSGDPADVWVHGGKPKTIRRFTPMPGAS